MPKDLDLGLLRAFVEVASTSNMTQAAKRLHVTQGAISQKIRRLEDQLGQQILVRSRSGLKPTDYGRGLIVRAGDLLDINDQIWREAEACNSAPTLRIGAPPDLFGRTICPLINAYQRDFPQSKVVLECAPSLTLSQRLLNNELDLAVVEELEGQEAGERIVSDQLVWVGARNGDAHNRDTLPVALVDRECVFRPDMVAALKAEGRPWQAIFESGSIDATASAVGADLAVTAWLQSTVPRDLEPLRRKVLPDLPRYSVSLRLSQGALNQPYPRAAEYIRNGLASLTRN